MLDGLLGWLQNNPDSSALAVFVLAMCEATVGIGLFIPGAVLLGVCTFLYAQELMSIAQIMPPAFAGAFIADQSGFWLGRWLGPGFHRSGFARRHRVNIERADAMIARYGWSAVLIGRLMTAIRSIVPLITGIGGYSPVKYLTFDLLAITIWTAGLGVLTLGTDKLFGG